MLNEPELQPLREALEDAEANGGRERVVRCTCAFLRTHALEYVPQPEARAALDAAEALLDEKVDRKTVEAAIEALDAAIQTDAAGAISAGAHAALVEHDYSGRKKGVIAHQALISFDTFISGVFEAKDLRFDDATMASVRPPLLNAFLALLAEASATDAKVRPPKPPKQRAAKAETKAKPAKKRR